MRLVHTEEVTLLFVRVGCGRLLGVLGRRASGRGCLAGIPRVIVLDVGRRRCPSQHGQGLGHDHKIFFSSVCMLSGRRGLESGASRAGPSLSNSRET